MMMEGAVLLGGLGLVVVSLYRRLREDRELRRAWREAAHEAGVQVTSGDTWGVGELVGQAGEHRVVIDEVGDGDSGNRTTRVVIEGGSGITLRRETLGTAIEKRLLEDEIQLGDEAFDREFYVRGPARHVRPLLDADARTQLRDLLGGRIRLAGGRDPHLDAEVSLLGGHLHAEISGPSRQRLHADLSEVLTALLAVARRLQPPAHPAQRLADNNRGEPAWRVRHANLTMLVERYPHEIATREALKRACHDESDQVRLQAALFLNDEGRGTLLEIACRDSADDGCAAKALAALGKHLPGEAALAVLESGLRLGRTETVLACLAELGRRGDPGAIDRLAEVLAKESPTFGVAAARALGTTGRAAAETPLLGALKGDLSDVTRAAVEALGRVGTAAAVLPLQETAARKDADGRLRRGVRQAVAEIQSRIEGSSPGQLSIADAEGGQLSLAGQDPAGRVSIAKPADDE